MKLISKILWILSISFQLNTQCTEGCLTCNGADKCILCDFTNGFYFSDYSCKINKVDNCTSFDLNGHCLLCDISYFID